ncbi:MAG: hypothetical protein Pg6C_19410 [Treponemataceae bacterium]|nr:MAG: hypothetical protein Pg6C_19410 [Treponemataceae bacterium]
MGFATDIPAMKQQLNRFDDGIPGRVSYVDMVMRGRSGMTMNRAIAKPPYREQIIVTQNDIDYAQKQVSIDGVITRDDDGNVIIIISATHRRIITPAGEITEVFEKPEEFTAFFFNYTDKYPKVVRATGFKGEPPYLAAPLKKGMPARIYMRVIPYEEICVIESVNYPIKGCAYHGVRATESFMQKYPDATYLENAKDGLLIGGRHTEQVRLPLGSSFAAGFDTVPQSGQPRGTVQLSPSRRYAGSKPRSITGLSVRNFLIEPTYPVVLRRDC